MIELLWMNEDELREHCHLLVEALLVSEHHRIELVNNMGKALAYGYNRGYADAAVQLKIETQERNAEGFILH
jgi:hypothetical protein